MFRVSLFCEDKKLADVLHNLAGLAAGMPEIVPVANAVAKNGKVSAANGSMVEAFAKYVKAHKVSKFRSAELADFCKETGLAPSSRSYLIKQLQKAGAVKKHGVGQKTYYSVNT